MIKALLSKVLAVASRSHQRIALKVDTSDALAGVLINRFDSALYAIPKALHGTKAEDEGLKLLCETRDVLAKIGGEDGYSMRRKLLDHFINLIERRGGDALKE